MTFNSNPHIELSPDSTVQVLQQRKTIACDLSSPTSIRGILNDFDAKNVSELKFQQLFFNDDAQWKN
jgi:cell division protein ZapA (FtsZ GTPase activity inhibitor)